MEVDTEVDGKASTNFHGSKYTSNLLPLTSSLLPFTSMEVGGNFHGVSRSNGIRWALMECLWQQLQFAIPVEVGGSI